MKTLILLTALVASPVIAQDAVQRADGTTVVQQRRLSVGDVLGGKVQLSKTEKDTLKEQKRHNKAMEKELRGMIKDRRDSPFTLGHARKQPRQVRSLPANSSSY
jgi:chaperonin cofactor prefoldin